MVDFVNDTINVIGNRGEASAADTYAFERTAATLIPFDMSGENRQRSNASDAVQNGPLGPIYDTGGLVFPFNPTISEGINVSYEPMKVVQSNESYHVYQSTENQQLNLADCVWVADTFHNARYVLSVIHFLRSYSLMDFGRGRSGKPPSPMWFNAYGNYAFNKIPVLLVKADWTWPSNEEMDYVGIPEPGSEEWDACKLATSGSQGSGPYTWIPIKFKVNSISLIVQHSPRYWIGYNLDDYRSGKMLKDRGGFHIDPDLDTGPLVSSTDTPTIVPSGTQTPTSTAPIQTPPVIKSPSLDPNVGNGILSGISETAGGG